MTEGSSAAEEEKRLFIIGQAIAAQMDVQRVCNRLVEGAVYVAGAQEGYLFLREADSAVVRLRARMKQGQQVAEEVDLVVEDPLVRGVLASGAPHIFPGTRAVAESAHTRASIDMPFKVRGHCVGVLRVLRADVHQPFAAREEQHLSVLASYAALAIENAELRAGIEDVAIGTALGQICDAFTSTLHLDTVLEMTIDIAAHLVDADRGHVVLRDDRSGQYVPRGSHALKLDELDDLWFVPAKQVVHQVLDQGAATLTVTDAIPVQDGTDIAPRPVLCLPIVCTGELIGAIYLERSDIARPFTKQDLATLETVSLDAAVAIDNARSYARVQAEGRKLDAVLRGTDQPVVVTDVGGMVLLMNHAARRAFSAQQGRGTGMLFVQVIQHPALTNLLDQARISGHVQYGEISAADERTYNVTVTPIPEVGAVTVMQDVTEINKLSQLKSEFVSTVSHDLRSPLSVVQGFLSVLHEAGPINEMQADFIASAQREVSRLFALTGSLLDLGKLESGLDLEMEPCDLRDVVSKAVANWQGKAGEKQHTLALSVPSLGVVVYGSPSLLRQVVDNLVNNAIKYSLPGGRIGVQLSQVGREAVLRIQDTGIGIAPKDQPYVFDRFYRVRNEYTRDIEGTGLGLAIVRRIVERHGGRVWLESALGQGTTVGVVLPLLEG